MRLPVLLLAMAFGQQPTTLPELQLPGLDGETHTLEEGAGPRLIVFWKPEMKASIKGVKLAAEVAEQYPQLGVVTIVSGDVDQASIEESWRSFADGPAGVLLDPERTAFSRLHIVAIPTFLLTGPGGELLLRVASMPADLKIRLADALHRLYPPEGGEEAAGGDPDAIGLPEPALRRLRMAEMLYRRGLASEAGAQIEDVIARYPESEDVVAACFYTALRLDLEELAGRALEAYRSLAPDGKQTAAGEAYLLARRGRFEEAARLAGEVSADDPRREWIEKIEWPDGLPSGVSEDFEPDRSLFGRHRAGSAPRPGEDRTGRSRREGVRQDRGSSGGERPAARHFPVDFQTAVW